MLNGEATNAEQPVEPKGATSSEQGTDDGSDLRERETLFGNSLYGIKETEEERFRQARWRRDYWWGLSNGRAIARLVPETGRRQEEIAKALVELDELRKMMPRLTLDEILAARHKGHKY